MRELKRELWPFRIELTLAKDPKGYSGVERWLDENVGKFGIQWTVVHKFTGTDYYFRAGPDATLFALKWT